MAPSGRCAHVADSFARLHCVSPSVFGFASVLRDEQARLVNTLTSDFASTNLESRAVARCAHVADSLARSAFGFASVRLERDPIVKAPAKRHRDNRRRP